MSESPFSIVRDFVFKLQSIDLDSPIAIEITEKTATAIKQDLFTAIRWDERSDLSHNELLFDGILFIAPKNFRWKH